MRIAVMGSGGIGGYLGGKLAAAGADVTMIARGAHLAAMQRDGLLLSGPKGEVHAKPIRATGDPAEIGPVDAVLLCVKLYDLETASAAIRPLLGPDTAVVTMQNGVDAVDAVGAVVGRGHVLGGVAYIFAAIDRPGVIKHGPGRFIVGEPDGSQSARAKGLVETCTGAGIDMSLSADIAVDLWDKFVLLAPSSGMTALTRATMGPIRDDPDTMAMLRAGVAEAAAVGRARGVRLADDLEAQVERKIMSQAPDSKSSMARDLELGNRLELPWLAGAVARLGRTAGVATPVHAFITTALKLHVEGRPRN